MTKDVLLSISGLQFAAQDEEDVEPVEVITAGDYYKKNGKGKKAEVEGVLLTNVKIFQVLHRSNRYSRASGIRMWDMSLTKKFLCERFRLVGIVNLC